MILVTGGAGFIGSALIWHLNNLGQDRIVVVDRLGLGIKWQNLAKRNILNVIHRDQLNDWLDQHGNELEVIFHMGACSATTERDADFLIRNNVGVSQRLWQQACARDIPFIYASSAATSGAEEHNFSDDSDRIPSLRPINKYGFSKQLFDLWALKQQHTPSHWYGIKFFNVYGPQEYHKGGQASVVYHAFHQIQKTGRARLFKSYRSEIADGQQLRDFVYVKDVVKVLTHLWLRRREAQSGIYNLGTGQARSFYDLATSVYRAVNQPANIEWIAMPESLQSQYQYFTQAELSRLRSQASYEEPFTSLEEGILDYVSQHLISTDPYL